MRPDAVSPNTVSLHAGRWLLALAGLPVLLLFPGFVSAATINVPADQPTIQAAINAAAPGDTVLVAPGTYAENINFLGKDLILTSTDPTDPNIVAATIIDGSQPTDPEKASVVTFENGETAAATLTGFTITGGTGTLTELRLLPNWEALSPIDVLLYGDLPNGIALDTVNDKIYWTDHPFDMYTEAFTKGRIRKANLDGTAVEDVVIVDGLRPYRIAVDSSAGKIYWTDTHAGKIQRADLDGSNIEDVVTGLSAPQDIALDVLAGKLYWSQLDTFTSGKGIRRANLDGTGVEDLIPRTQAELAYIALDLMHGKVYWTDFFSREIWRANLDGLNAEILVPGNANRNSTSGIAVDPIGMKMYWTQGHPSRNAGDIRRANLDGTNVEILDKGPAAPQAIALDPAAGKMYWGDVYEKIRKIFRSNMDGTGREVLFRGWPMDGGGIYCLNNASPTITKNIIRDNGAKWGAGLFAALGSLPTVTHNRFIDNTAEALGGALYIDYPFDRNEPPVLAPIVTHNLITRNQGLAAAAMVGSSGTFANNTVVRNEGVGFLASNIGPAVFISVHTPIFPVVYDNTFAGNIASKEMPGAAILCSDQADATIARNTIVLNHSLQNGGSVGIPAIFPASILTISDNAILYNSASKNGGGFYAPRGGSSLVGNTFLQNVAGQHGGGIFSRRSAISSAINHPGLLLADNFLIENFAAKGGASYFDTFSSPANSQGQILVQNRILRNHANIGAAIMAGSPINEKFDPSGLRILLGNVIADNHADFGPAGVLSRFIPSSALYAGNTIVGNTSGDPAAINGLDYNCELSFPDGDVFANNLLHDNAIDITPGCPDAGEPTYSNISDGTYVPGVFGSNVSVPDPGFIDPANGDYHLADGSALIDTGDPAYVAHTIDPSGRFNSLPDLPTFLETDADGNPRIANGRVDIGAYEFDPAAARPSPDPMDFATAKVVADAGQLIIMLTAKAATVPADAAATVEYLFESPTGAKKGPTSGWQDSPTFVVTGLEVGQWYTYRVKARNASRPDQETHVSPIRAFFVTAPGDLDRDGDVDIFDFLSFSSCYNGTGAAPTAVCDAPFADLDDDGDVDGDDFLTLGACFNGTMNPPKCP